MAARLVIGCGYLGGRVARRWLDAGDAVSAVTRRSERAAAFERGGITPIVADVTDSRTLDLPPVDSVLFAVAHDPASGKNHADTHVTGLANVLDALPPSVGRVIYISTTGVYGDCQGTWATEETPCQPQRPAGKACLAAERLLEAHPLGRRAIILRLAGLYGPDRIPRQDVLLAGETIDAPQHGYLNLIHVDDAVQAVLAADIVDADLPRRYLIADGNPPQRGEYYAELARLIGAPPPRFRAPECDTPAYARAIADKRISNARMLADLKLTLLYPSYREGLRAIVIGQAR